MLFSNPRWNAIKEWGKSAARALHLETVCASVIIPIVEAVFVNLWTGAKQGEGTSFGVALIAIGVVHLILVFILLVRQGQNPIESATAILELEEKIEQIGRDRDEREKRAEQLNTDTISLLSDLLQRKTDSHDMLRRVLNTFNLQTCQIQPESPDAFSKGLMPIIQAVACSASRTLGVKSNAFTVELYYLNLTNEENQSIHNLISSERVESYSYVGYIEPGLFYSSSGLDSWRLNLMGDGSAFLWGWSRGVPGTCCIDDDKHLFYSNGAPREDIHFRNFATVPVSLVCSSDCVGILALTSMQCEKFDNDTLETMEFISSVISQYIASHERCVNEWRATKKKEEEKRKREERKAAKQLEQKSVHGIEEGTAPSHGDAESQAEEE